MEGSIKVTPGETYWSFEAGQAGACAAFIHTAHVAFVPWRPTIARGRGCWNWKRHRVAVRPGGPTARNVLRRAAFSASVRGGSSRWNVVLAPDDGCSLLDRDLQRVCYSAEYLGFAFLLHDEYRIESDGGAKVMPPGRGRTPGGHVPGRGAGPEDTQRSSRDDRGVSIGEPGLALLLIQDDGWR